MDLGSEFRLLGDVEVRVDGELIELGHPRQRYVLAVLLIEANRPVPVDKLFDRVWGEDQPHRGRSTLYSYLSRIRSILAPAGDVALRRQSNGYLLAVDPAAVDLVQFERMVAEARSAPDEQAMNLFTRALGLWRGDALAGMDSPWLNAVRTAMNRERLQAELDRNDVALRQGRHGGLLPALQDRAEKNPLDERLAGQLMLALYRNGRAAEALDQFQRMRRRLAEELGTEPSAALSQMHQSILVADPALAAPNAATTPAPVVPRQLPAAPRLFTGRARETAYLDEVLGGESGNGERPDPVAVVAVGGIGGIGKTCLVLHWAHRNVARFPDGQLYLNLRGFDPGGPPMPAAVALRALLDALGVPPGEIPQGIDAQAGLYRSLVSGRRMLLVLDNAHDSAQLTSLLPGDPSCAVLITSRHRLGDLVTSHGVVPLELDVLDEDEARRLLTGHLGPDRVNDAADSVRELLDCCSGLPLALSMVAARAAARPGFPLAAIAEELRELTTRLDALGTGELTSNLRAVFSCSLDAVEPEAAGVFGLLGLTPGADVSLLAAASLTGWPVARIRLVLANLEYAYLIQQHKPGRYRMHDLVRLYAVERAVRDYSERARDAATTRLIDYYLHTAHAGERLLRPYSEAVEVGLPAKGCTIPPLADPAAALAWFEDEHSCLLAAHRLAVAQDRPSPVWQLAWALDTFHSRRGYQNENVTLWEAGLKAAGQLADPDARMLAHRRLGHALSVVGNHAEARDHLHKALALAERREDTANQAHTQIALGWAWELDGDDDRALSHCLEALQLFQTLGDTAWEAIALNAVGWYSARLGQYDSARTYCVQALALNRRNRNRPGEAATLDSLGYIAHCTGEHAQAVAHYRNALELYREFGDHYTEADTLVRLSEARATAGKGTAASRDLKQALSLYQAQQRWTDAERVRWQLAALE